LVIGKWRRSIPGREFAQQPTVVSGSVGGTASKALDAPGNAIKSLFGGQ
jgi:hypothetical protein